jgi:hypothetical protein
MDVNKLLNILVNGGLISDLSKLSHFFEQRTGGGIEYLAAVCDGLRL